MIYLITAHFLINTIILAIYITSKESEFEDIWKEGLITIFFGWIVVFILDEE